MTSIEPIFTLGIDRSPIGKTRVFDVYRLNDKGVDLVGYKELESYADMADRLSGCEEISLLSKEPLKYETKFEMDTDRGDRYLETLKQVVEVYQEEFDKPLKEADYSLEIHRPIEKMEDPIARFFKNEVPVEVANIGIELQANVYDSVVD